MKRNHIVKELPRKKKRFITYRRKIKKSTRVLNGGELGNNFVRDCKNQKGWIRNTIESKQDYHTEVQNKKLEDYTLAKLLQMKEDIEEAYGKEVFESYICKDITRFLGFSERKKLDLEMNSTVKMDPDVATPIPQGKKDFVEVLLNGNVKEMKITKEEDVHVPLKPLLAPRMARGNVGVEVDEEEYCRGVEELKHNVIGKLTLQ